MRRLFSEFLATLRSKNIIPKFISFLLAVVLWAYLSSNNKEGELQFRIALSVENLPGNMAISKISNRFVTALVSGRPDLLTRVHPGNVKALLDLSNPKLGLAEYPIKIIRNEIPENVGVSLRQSFVSVFVETRISKPLRIAPVITGSPAEGYAIGHVRVKPDIVNASGPGSVLSKLAKIDTPAIPVDGAEKDISLDVSVKSEQLSLLELRVNTVQVFIPVAKEGSFLDLTVPIEIEAGAKYEASLTDAKTAVVHMRNMSGTRLPEDINLRAVIDCASADVEALMKNKKNAVRNFPVGIVYDKNMYNLEVLFISPEEAPVSISAK